MNEERLCDKVDHELRVRGWSFVREKLTYAIPAALFDGERTVGDVVDVMNKALKKTGYYASAMEQGNERMYRFLVSKKAK